VIRTRWLAPLFASVIAAGPALAQDQEDVVFDNQKRDKEREKQREDEFRKEAQTESPFADDVAPSAAEKRAERWSPGFEGGYRAGWAIPGGTYAKGRTESGEVAELDFSKTIKGMIFLWLDGGYRFIPELTVGLYVSIGYVLPDCQGEVSCTFWDFRGGPQVQWRFLPFAEATPWVGLAGGYEYMSRSASLADVSVTEKAHGFELVNFQAGVDFWAPAARGHVGLFVSYSLGRFRKFSISSDDETQDISREPATHSWLAIGGRGTF
jgi:hypothetical protein